MNKTHHKIEIELNILFVAILHRFKHKVKQLPVPEVFSVFSNPLQNLLLKGNLYLIKTNSIFTKDSSPLLISGTVQQAFHQCIVNLLVCGTYHFEDGVVTSKDTALSTKGLHTVLKYERQNVHNTH